VLRASRREAMGGGKRPGAGRVRSRFAYLSFASILVAVPLVVFVAPESTAPADFSSIHTSVVALAKAGAPTLRSYDTPAVSVRQPSWWDGSCDAGHWDPAAQAAGWSGEGAHPLGASFLGVEVCGPRPAVDDAPDVIWTRPGYSGLEWECVELAMRFLGLVYGVRAYSADGYDVVADYTQADGGGLVKIANGTPGVSPEPGDVMSLSDGGEGHVVVVASSDVNGYGNGQITVMSQNDTTDGWRSLQVSDWTVEGFNIFTPTGWLHDPLGRGDPYAAPVVTTTAISPAAVGLQYAQVLSASGGSGPYKWSIAQGTLPDGLSLDASTGAITGVPGEIVSSAFVVRVTSSAGASSLARFSLSVGRSKSSLDAADFEDDLSVG
jgi:Putative Ig domain/CHAP domain